MTKRYRGPDRKPRRRPEPGGRFWPRIVKTESCWNWTGPTDKSGYGLFHHAKNNVMAHRFAYEALVGEIPAGLELDHLCRNTLCVNPDHLEPVTHQENMRRAAAHITHCPSGHPYDEENTYRHPNGSRRCRTCHRATVKRFKARNKASVVTP